MGRKIKNDENKKTVIIQVYMTKTQQEMIEKTAVEEFMSASRFILKTVMKSIENKK